MAAMAFTANRLGFCNALHRDPAMAFCLKGAPHRTLANAHMARGRMQMTIAVLTRLHSMPAEKIDMFQSLQGWAETNILGFLKPVEKSWQPQDFLPDPSSDGFLEEVEELRMRSMELPAEYFVCLVGNMITEEALPTYQTMLNTLDGVRDETGASLTPWARWTRAWTAEENRHGDLLNKYLYLSRRVDMRAVEKTI
ncbi:hypothetical protein L7F22_066621 [Adiantum nelumboides]|nr:hypothetical protein [Adiantum nelumboides]